MRRKIQKLLDEHINPYVASHGGKIELVDVVDGKVMLNMSGGCQGCSQSSVTLRQGVESLLKEHFGDMIKEVVDTTDHQHGDNPYFS
jgi:Fe/S biogenesis protein NfuA